MQGGDLFRRDRQVDGTPFKYDVAGLWGSGNVITERELPEADKTLYTMWSGEGLVGPRAGEHVEKYPAIWGRQPLGDFLEQFASAPIECLVMVGDEDGPPVGRCQDVCRGVRDTCDVAVGGACLDRCTPEAIDALSRCVEDAADCTAIAACFE